MKLLFPRITLLLLWLPYSSIGQIQLPDLFTNQMVLQRNVSIPIWGQTTPSVKITATIELENSTDSPSREESSGWSDAKGNWQLNWSAKPAGGPYKITLSTEMDTVIIRDILIGEVWICSGQSNMEWPLKNSKFYQEALEDADQPNIRLFHLKKIHNMYNASFSVEQAAAINQFNFFEKGSWEACNPEVAAEFSAVGFYFSKLMHDSLKGISIGIIQNAVSGSPAQSWHQSSQEEQIQWLNNKTFHPWLAERARENWGNQMDPLIHHHPFEPGYLFKSAVLPLAPFPVKGILWYQGESNATHPTSYPQMMKRVIEDWRKAWGYELPFYSVELPRISNRSRWPEFRAQQKEILQLPNTGIISIIDEGHTTDVHPNHKRVVGHRLAWLVLRQLYQKSTAPISPEFKSFQWNTETHTMVFSINTQGISLSPSVSDSIPEIELFGYSADGRQTLIMNPDISVKDSSLILRYPPTLLPVKVRYAWKPFPEGIIKNNQGMPLFPFEVNLPGNN